MKKLLTFIILFLLINNHSFSQRNLIDSLHNINYFDYYDKEISVLLSNDFFADYKECYPITYEWTNLLHYVQFNFGNRKKGYSLSIYPNFTTEVNYDTWSIDSISHFKIKKIGESIAPLNIRFNITDSLSIIDTVKNKTIEDIFDYATSDGHSGIFFGHKKLNDDDNSHLNYLTGILIFSNHRDTKMMIRIHVDTNDKIILDLSKEHWNLNKLKDVKITKIWVNN